MNDSIVMDFRELQLKWAVEEIADEVSQLLDYLEKAKDLEGIEHFCRTIAAINNYNKLIEVQHDL